MSFEKRKIVAVIGGTQSSPQMLRVAEQVGHLIAEYNYILVTGGGTGIMEAASKGARENGGLVLGILPEDDCSAANPYVDIPIVTGLGAARNIIIVRSADILIAIDGKFGTLSEIAYAAQLNKPIIGIHTWEIEGTPVQYVSTPEQALELTKKLVDD